MGAAPPEDCDDEREHLLAWLGYVRGAVLRNAEGLDDEASSWTPQGRLLPIVGIVNHLTRVEWRWIDGGFRGATVSRSGEEFFPTGLAIADAVAAYRERAARTDDFVRSVELATASGSSTWARGATLRWVLLHLINETARHAGHADATRELFDGTVGE